MLKQVSLAFFCGMKVGSIFLGFAEKKYAKPKERSCFPIAADFTGFGFVCCCAPVFLLFSLVDAACSATFIIYCLPVLISPFSSRILSLSHRPILLVKLFRKLAFSASVVLVVWGSGGGEANEIP